MLSWWQLLAWSGVSAGNATAGLLAGAVGVTAAFALSATPLAVATLVAVAVAARARWLAHGARTTSGRPGPLHWDAGNEPCSRSRAATRSSHDARRERRPDHAGLRRERDRGLDWDRVYPLAGPIAVDGAEPGDTLAVEILDLHTQGWGWTAIMPGLGLLPDDFPDAYLRIFDLTDGDTRCSRRRRDPARAVLRDDGRLPGRRAEAGGDAARHVRRQHGHAPAHPRAPTLYLPVQVAGALFSCGDAHAAQGDGEVCVTGIETPMDATLRLTLEKGRSSPRRSTGRRPAARPRVDRRAVYGTTGVGPDLYAAAQDAVRAMIDHLAATLRALARGRVRAREPRAST